ncbi:MAG: hypothetical protein J6W29_03090 [Neisseriaceae bacterium]|nr:hypothetical protein [Neisseriaceae bacterium]
MFGHKWKWFEDLEVATATVNRKVDPKSIKKLSALLGISESKIAARINNYTKLVQGAYPDWHYSKQEIEVFEWLLSRRKTVTVKTNL